MARLSSIAIVVVLLTIGCSSPKNGANNRTTGAATDAAGASSEQLVTLTGCLTGGETPVGTAGPTARPPVASSKTADEAQALRGDGSSAANRFMLTQARPAADDSRGVGANGVGGSGGPLVNGVADYAVEGNATVLTQHINHQVIVKARINARQTVADAPRAQGNTSSNDQPSTIGTVGSRDDVRTLVVESIQTVSPTCAQP